MEIFDFFLDSSVIIEGFKENNRAIEIITFLRSVIFKKIFVNEVVWSEVVYQLCIKRNFNKKDAFYFLDKFFFLEVKKDVIKYAEKLLENYNLKPNDSLILSTCKHYGIKHLISLDEDFEEPCKKEGITLINSLEKLKGVLSFLP
jgi:predicted nucleic acid-binding protein